MLEDIVLHITDLKKIFYKIILSYPQFLKKIIVDMQKKLYN